MMFNMYSEHRTEEWVLVSYTSEDKKSDRERYIRVATIDIAITQGTWNAYHICEMGKDSPLLPHY
jgi:hypothetical protein